MSEPAPSITRQGAPRFYNGRQSSQMTQLYRTTSGVKLRLDIKCDSVAFKSYARASAFEPVKPEWTVIASIPFRDLEVLRAGVDPYRAADNHARAAFARDTAKLLRVLELLLRLK